MPRRSILSAAERDSLLALPDSDDELIRQYTFSQGDLSLIRQRRGDANRLGFAVQLCLLRFPGQGLLTDASVAASLIRWIGQQLHIDPACWPQYAEREETRREHLLELRAYLGIVPFGLAHLRQAMHATTDLALQTDKGVVLAASVLDTLRQQHIIIPALDVVERICAGAITQANRRIHTALTDTLSDDHRQRLENLLKRKDDRKLTWLAWLRLSPVRPNSRHMLEHIERLKAWQALNLPAGIERLVHQNRLLKIAREGAQMTPADLASYPLLDLTVLKPGRFKTRRGASICPSAGEVPALQKYRAHVAGKKWHAFGDHGGVHRLQFLDIRSPSLASPIKAERFCPNRRYKCQLEELQN